jgi:hypothetical protein
MVVVASTVCGCGADSGSSQRVDRACVDLWNSTDVQTATLAQLQAERFRVIRTSVTRVENFSGRCLVTYVLDLGSGVQLGYQYVKELNGMPGFPWQKRSDIPLSDLPDSVKNFNAHFSRDGLLHPGPV